MVNIEACVGPETASHVWPVFGGEAGTLAVLLERSPEDPLVTPAQAGVVQEGPAGNLPAEAVADEAALVDRGEGEGQQVDQLVTAVVHLSHFTRALYTSCNNLQLRVTVSFSLLN